MLKLGEALAQVLISRQEEDSRQICLAYTVEDADYLAKGMIDILQQHTVSFARFWNKRQQLADNSATIAPIFRRYCEPGYQLKTGQVEAKPFVLSLSKHERLNRPPHSSSS